MQSEALSNILGLVGAVVGGGVGFIIFRWVAGQGFYAPFLLGGLSGLGCMALARHASTARGVVCGMMAVAFELVAEGFVFPFVRDARFAFFFTHLHWLPPIKIVLILFGGLLAGYLGSGSIVRSSVPARLP
jgi:hypothetical protein